RISRLLTPVLIGIAVVSAFFGPRLLDYALGVVFLAIAARGLWGLSDGPAEEPDGSRWRGPLRVAAIGVIGLFGGGAVAWGGITAARVAAGVVGLAFFAMAYAMPRGQRDTEAMGCAVLLGLFAATGCVGLFPTFLEQAVWPGTPVGQTARGVGGYLLVWLAGL